MTKLKSWHNAKDRKNNSPFPTALSKETKNTIRTAFSNRTLNIGLYFTKFIIAGKRGKISPKHQMETLLSCQNRSNDYIKGITWQHVPKDYFTFLKRRKYFFATLKQMGYYVKKVKLSLSWRLLVNLGMASVYETSLLLHRNYSVPYIPGTAVKGVIRHFVENNPSSVPPNIGEIDYIFGGNDNKGELLFFDAFPLPPQVDSLVDSPLLVVDVMNVHYADYYRDNQAPGDWMNPNPIFFLAVEKNTTFSFCFAIHKKHQNQQQTELLDHVETWLKEATTRIGIGAKTSSGYGFFTTQSTTDQSTNV